MLIEIAKCDFSSLSHLWSNESARVASRKQEWKRIKLLFLGEDKTTLSKIKAFMVDGVASDFSIVNPYLLYVLPWETAEEFREVMAFLAKNNKGVNLVDSLIRCRIVSSLEKPGSIQLLLEGARWKVLESFFLLAECQFPAAVRVWDLTLPFNFKTFVQFFELSLLSCFREKGDPADYLHLYLDFYFGYCEYCISNNETIEHIDKIYKILVIAKYYGPNSFDPLGRKKKIDLAKAFIERVNLSPLKEHFASIYDVDSKVVHTYSHDYKDKNSSEDLIVDSANRFFFPGFFINVDVASVAAQLAKEVDAFNSGFQVDLCLSGSVDLSPELIESGVQSLGLWVDGAVPAKKWVLSVQGPYDLVSKESGEKIAGAEELTIQLDLYEFLSEEKAKCNFGSVTGAACLHYAPVFEKYYLDVATSWMCRAIHDAITTETNDQFKYFVKTGKGNDWCMVYSNPPHVIKGMADMIRLNLNGFKERVL
ncbi:hypothetical protein [Saccharophagus degradans]|uniref:Uncharacterized protein n=1 Tax=Saccharophagus degradans TaxID=86304 RepID=A0AAW7X3K5_9GAMM|nr:hypothetical protein [Saccharophagus degradans]MDO6421138.1 hypothetical protein [Saccharophagus degradans]MDO6605951.1 hypothetical protein [Saccharophagus degradans]